MSVTITDVGSPHDELTGILRLLEILIINYSLAISLFSENKYIHVTPLTFVQWLPPDLSTGQLFLWLSHLHCLL